MTNGLAEGGKAPAFKLPDQDGDDISLADFAGQKLVLYFYPKADTPGCTQEAMDFSKLANSFTKAGTAVLGVSADPVGKLVRFRQKHGLSVPLLSDERHAMLEAYGVWGEKTLYGRKFMGVKRTTVLIGPDGRIAKLWQNVKVPGHAEAVLAAAKAL
jgi:peroxiredoxin Q/BCP